MRMPVALVFAALAPLVACEESQAQTDDANKIRGVSVVELFTSQGCSSCPPADRLLAVIDGLAEERGLPIYVLSMHVDYWNSLGWVDPYSQKAFTDRQRRYAAAAGEGRVYTPQMIVSGRRAFVGSGRDQAQAAVSEALAQPPTAKIELEVEPTAGVWRVAYEVTGNEADFEGAELVVCLTADAAPNHVPRGENSGKDLTHVGVVRTLATQSLKETSGQIQLTWPTNQPRGDEPVSVVAFVQDAPTMAIRGATRWAEGG